MNIFKKFLKRIFKIRPQKKYVSFPLNISEYEKLIIIWDDEDEKIRKIFKNVSFKNKILIIKEDKKNEEFFLKELTSKTLIIDPRDQDKKIFLKYVSCNFPVIGRRKSLNFVLPGKSVEEFFGYFFKILV